MVSGTLQRLSPCSECCGRDSSNILSNSKFLTPWAEESGFMPPILMNMALITIFSSCGIIFWFWGKKFRGMSSKSFVHQL